LFGKKDIHLLGTVKGICIQFSKNLTVVAYDLSKILLPELKNWSEISQSKMYANYRHYFTIFVTLIPAIKMQKESLKKCENFPSIACTFVKHLFDICQSKKRLCKPTTDNWFIGFRVLGRGTAILLIRA
jgi:hypothetical protein